MRNAAYPPRPPFFACKFVRRMGKLCLGNDIGPDACWLLAFIAATEDAKGYRAAVSFYNDDLATRTGLSLASMKRARDRAVKAGWLHYEQGARGRAAKYFVIVPAWADGLDDGPGDEKPGELTPDLLAQIEPESDRASITQEGVSGRIVAQPEPESDQKQNAEEGYRLNLSRNPDGIRTESEPLSSLSLSLSHSAPESGASHPNQPSKHHPKRKPKSESSAKQKKRGRPNPLFDAIEKAAGADRSIDGSYIGKVSSHFAKAIPPITPQEVMDFAENWRVALPWAKARDHPVLTIGILEKHITTFRNWRKANGSTGPPGEAKTPIVKTAADNPQVDQNKLKQNFGKMELPNAA